MSSDNAKTAVLIIAVGFLVLSIFSWFPNPEVKDYVRTAISFVILWFLYQGKSWARWLMGVLSALASVFAVYALATLQLEPIQATPLLVMATFYVAASFLLLSGKIVGPHFDSNGT